MAEAEVVHCVYNPHARKNNLLHLLTSNEQGIFLLHLVGVNIQDDAAAIADRAIISLGVDILSGQETITPHCRLTGLQVASIISRTTPEISKAILDDFPNLLTT